MQQVPSLHTSMFHTCRANNPPQIGIGTIIPWSCSHAFWACTAYHKVWKTYVVLYGNLYWVYVHLITWIYSYTIHYSISETAFTTSIRQNLKGLSVRELDSQEVTVQWHKVVLLTAVMRPVLCGVHYGNLHETVLLQRWEFLLKSCLDNQNGSSTLSNVIKCLH